MSRGREQMEAGYAFISAAREYESQFKRVSFDDAILNSRHTYTATFREGNELITLKLYENTEGCIGFVTRVYDYSSERLEHSAIPSHIVFENKYLKGGYGLYEKDFIECVKKKPHYCLYKETTK